MLDAENIINKFAQRKDQMQLIKTKVKIEGKFNAALHQCGVLISNQSQKK